ncbi:Transcription factor IIIA [Desmophyllum pertusum]|uniref:Transcription factor IIIA n=1 Tax=Desmophyllum pertusum TaxID=174260 RepID=A0A9X0CRW8_9CNID|nr:Transcription factor IIIA [Desmophyllum pertusum]
MDNDLRLDSYRQTSKHGGCRRKRHVCSECGKSYNKNWRLKNIQGLIPARDHTSAHLTDVVNLFIRPYHLKRHVLVHTGATYKCSYPGCTQTFTLKYSLRRHVKRSHNNPFTCQYEGCDQSFKKSSQLTRHTCVHTNECLFKCRMEGCDAGFNSSSRLQRHMKKHNKGYICSTSGCSAAFDTFSKLTVHTRSHGYTCEHCSRTFKEVWELKKHAVIHNPNRKMYECPREGCNRVYTKAFNLKAHIKAFHDGERPYLCTVEGCEKGFAHKFSLKQHLVLHSQRRIKPTPSPQDKSLQKKKEKGNPCHWPNN